MSGGAAEKKTNKTDNEGTYKSHPSHSDFGRSCISGTQSLCVSCQSRL